MRYRIEITTKDGLEKVSPSIPTINFAKAIAGGVLRSGKVIDITIRPETEQDIQLYTKGVK